MNRRLLGSVRLSAHWAGAEEIRNPKADLPAEASAQAGIRRKPGILTWRSQNQRAWGNRSPILRGKVFGRFKPTKVGAPGGPGVRRSCGGRRLPLAERRLQSAYRVRRAARLGRNHALPFVPSPRLPKIAAKMAAILGRRSEIRNPRPVPRSGPRPSAFGFQGCGVCPFTLGPCRQPFILAPTCVLPAEKPQGGA
jgi:hypothetical protein